MARFYLRNKILFFKPLRRLPDTAALINHFNNQARLGFDAPQRLENCVEIDISFAPNLVAVSEPVAVV